MGKNRNMDINCPYCRKENCARIEVRGEFLAVVCSSCSRVGPKKATRRAALNAWWRRFDTWLASRKRQR